MTVLAGFRTRNLLTFVVPAIIAFLSAYWFHKKRKLKQISDENSNSQISKDVTCPFENAKDQNLTLSNDVSYLESEDELSGAKNEESMLSVEKCSEHLDTYSHCDVNGHVDVPVENILPCPNTEHTGVEGIGKNTTAFQINSVSCTSSTNTIIMNNDDFDSLSQQKISLDDSKTETHSCSVPENMLSMPGLKIPDTSISLIDSSKNEPLSMKTPVSEAIICMQAACLVKQNEVEVTHDDDESFCQVDKQIDHEFSNDVCKNSVKCIDSFTDVENSHQSEAELPSNSIVQKNSPTSTGSPVSHSNDTGSDCEALSSVGTSSISLSELFSTSPVDSVKEQMNFHVDAFVSEDASNDSGKGSTVNLDPISSCSLSSELNEVAAADEPRTNSFHYSRRSNADVLCRQILDSTEQGEDMNEQYNFYNDSNCNPSHLKKSVDTLSEVSGVSSSSSMKYVQVIDSKTLEPNASNHYVYEFELPQEFCGRFIGRQGKNVKFIKESSNATVYIKRHPYNPRLKLAVVEGSRSDVNNALELLHKKFPALSLAQTNAAVSALGVPVPESLQLQLPENTSVDVILSSMVSAGHFFLQQPTHPTYPSLSTLDQCMMACYSQGETPCLPQPIEAGVVCAASIMGGWYRAQVVFVFENNEECEVKFVDYGGYSRVSVSSLRQIRSDFMTLPFQASECYLAKVQPLNAEYGWSTEASVTFEELAQGQILQAVIVGYHEDGVPYVYLYRVQGITSTFINRELVSRGLAKWIEHQ